MDKCGLLFSLRESEYVFFEEEEKIVKERNCGYVYLKEPKERVQVLPRKYLHLRLKDSVTVSPLVIYCYTSDLTNRESNRKPNGKIDCERSRLVKKKDTLV